MARAVPMRPRMNAAREAVVGDDALAFSCIVVPTDSSPTLLSCGGLFKSDHQRVFVIAAVTKRL